MKSIIFKNLFLIIFIVGFTQKANANPPLFYPQKWDVKYFELALGAKFDSLIKKRGAVLFDSWQAIPLFSITWFTPQLTIAGTTLHYRHRINDNVLLRSRFLFSATPNALYSTGGVPKNTLHASTMEWDNHIEIGIPEIGEIKFTISQDVKAHRGTYFEAQARWVVTQFEVSQYVLYPAIYASIGAATAGHNRYLYRATTSSFEFNNYATGVSLTVSPNIDHFYPIFQFEHFGVIGQNNKVNLGRSPEGWYLQMLFAFRVI